MSEIATKRVEKMTLEKEKIHLELVGRHVLLALRETLDTTKPLVELDDIAATNLIVELSEKINRIKGIDTILAILKKDYSI